MNDLEKTRLTKMFVLVIANIPRNGVASFSYGQNND